MRRQSQQQVQRGYAVHQKETTGSTNDVGNAFLKI
jgi:hypothetical protein